MSLAKLHLNNNAFSRVESTSLAKLTDLLSIGLYGN